MTGPACALVLKVLAGCELTRRRALDARLRLSLGEVPARLWVFRGPHSLTGEDVLEVRVPGQADVIAALTTRLYDLGCRDAAPGEFTLRALRARKLDLSRAEAVMALISAHDDATRREALRALSGAAAARAGEIAAGLRELSARYELAFDFAEDEPAAPDTAAMRADAQRLSADLAAEAGAPRRPRLGAIRVALFGAPNAGKSSLFNALLGSPRALVSPLPGTTRDPVAATLELRGQTLELTDLSGVGGGDSDLGRFAPRARKTALSADVLLLVCAPGQAAALGAEFKRLCAQDAALRARAMWVHTMTDLGAAPQANPEALEQFAVSAFSGEGLDALCDALATRAREAASGALSSHLATAAREAAAALGIAADEHAPAEAVAAAVRKALRVVDEALFSEKPGEVLDLIFRRFCIGK